MEQPIIKVEAHKIIDSTNKAFPETISAVDHALSSVLNIVGYPTNYIGEYAKYSIQKLHSNLTKKLSEIPPDKIVAPPVHIAAPILEKSRFTADSEHLHALFANLLATSMTEDLQSLAHPSFVEIISQLSQEEAKILFDFPQLLPMCVIRLQNYSHSNAKHPLGEDFKLSEEGRDYIQHIILYNGMHPHTEQDFRKIASITENFERLGLIKLPDDGSYFIHAEHYAPILSVLKPFVKTLLCPPDQTIAIVPQRAQITDFGNRFLKACVL